jgi:hypothetical protein
MENRAGQPDIPARLQAPLDVHIGLQIPVEQAIEQLRWAIEHAPSAEPAGASSDRRIAGDVTQEWVSLTIRESSLVRRRKSWNIQFKGAFTNEGAGAALRGKIAIADYSSLRWLMRLFRVAAVVPPVLAIAFALAAPANGPPSLLVLPLAVLAFVAVFLGLRWLEISGERAAADDAEILAAFLRSRLA